MAGKRLLDAAAIFNAFRSIASKHIALRSHQLETYNKTSTLAKAVKSQTDRVTLTVQAASAIAQRFNETSSYSTQAQQGSAVPSKESTSGTRSEKGAKEGVQQDHFYEKSDLNSTSEPVPDGVLGVKQEKLGRHPLPDGTIPPAGSTVDAARRDKDVFSKKSKDELAKQPLVEENDESELGVKQEKTQRSPLPDGSVPPADAEIGFSSENKDYFSERSKAEPIKEAVVEGEGENAKGLQPSSSDASTIPEPVWHASPPPPDEARQLQRAAESQIPSQVAEQPSGSNPNPTTAELQKGHDEDVFYSRSSQSSPTLSSLPRTKLPRQAVATQDSVNPVNDGQINADVFYSSPGRQQDQRVPQTESVPEQDQVQEDVNTDVFHSPRIAKLLAGKDKSGPRGLKLKGAGPTPVEKTELAKDKDQDTFNVRSTEQQVPEALTQALPRDQKQSPSKESNDSEVQSLATDIAKDASSALSPNAEV